MMTTESPKKLRPPEEIVNEVAAKLPVLHSNKDGWSYEVQISKEILQSNSGSASMQFSLG